MRRLLTLLCAVAISVCTLSTFAQANGAVTAMVAPDNIEVTPRVKSADGFTVQPPTGWGHLQVLSPEKLKAAETRDAQRRLLGKPLARYRTNGVAGYYVGTYNTLAEGSYDGGNMMRLELDAEGDSLTIHNFWSGASVRAKYDSTEGTISIPRQKLGTDETFGRLDLAVVTSNATPDYEANIVGEIGTDGTIDFRTSWWGVFIQEGQYKDRFIGAYNNFLMTPPNGTMETSRPDANKPDSVVTNSYGILIQQTSPNTLKITNFFNRGLDIEVNLNRNRSTAIENQVAMKNSSGSFVIIKCLGFNDAGNLTQYSTTLTTEPADADNNTILEWTDWSLLCTEARVYAGRYLTGKLTSSAPFSYPTLSVSDFEGDGSETNPFLIKSRDHLILLADKVNQDTVFTGKWYNVDCTRTYLGKHFALTNDIDMESYRSEAIGQDYQHHFAGNLDGRGFTIKNLNVKGGSSLYSGLFGMCDSTTVIKNLHLENPVLDNALDYSGCLAGSILGGLVENVIVVNPYIFNLRYGTGAIVGVSGVTMRNCHVVDGRMASLGYIGGIAGECKGGMENCSVVGTEIYHLGTVGPSGGVVGNLLGNPATNLSFSGLLSYSNTGEAQDIGGVAGWVQGTTLSNSFMSGIVKGYSNLSRVGGVVGVLRGDIENCYSSGHIHCFSRMCAGIIGQILNRTDFATTGRQPQVKNCYTSAVVESETYMYNPNNTQEVIGQASTTENPAPVPVVENVFFDRNITNYKSTRYGSNTQTMTSAQGLEGFSTEVWEFSEGAYPRLKISADTESAKYSASAINFVGRDNLKKISNNTPLTALGNTTFLLAKGKELSTEGHYANIQEGMLNLMDAFGRDTLYICNGNVQTYRVVNLSPLPFEGEGTAESPLLIKTKADLILLAEATTVKGQTFPGIHFRMTNDIDLELDTAFVGISTKAVDTYNRFEGVFDGGGFTIHRMLIPGRVVWSTPPSPGVKGTLNASACAGWSGFIGRLGKDGVLRNLSIAADSQLEMYATCGAFVGANYGLIENCRNYADVIGYSCWVGGIAGKNEEGTATVRNCYNSGNITTCYANVGGIVGSSYGIIENCANTGEIKVVSLITNYSNVIHMAGGIVGNSTSGTSVSNCLNMGEVHAGKQKAGGIIGASSSIMSDGIDRDSISSCLNIAYVFCPDRATTGAVVGDALSKNWSNVYFDTQLLALNAANGKAKEGIIGAESSVLTSGNPIDGLSADLWDFRAGQYPVLKSFINEPRVVATRKISIDASPGTTLANLHTSVELGKSATWTLKNGNPTFTLDDRRLSAPPTVSIVESDTLLAVDSLGMIHHYAVVSLPANPLQGKGTAEEPYLINSTDDWNALSEYMNSTFNTLDGEFYKVTSDLDFTGVTPRRLGKLAATPFMGILDGSSHTIKGLELSYTANRSGALFGTLTEGATLCNFTIEGAVNSAFTYTAGLVDNLYGTLENINCKVNVTSSKSNAAGVVGYAYGGAVLRNIHYSGTVSSSSTSLGGIVNTTTEGVVTFDNVVFEGTVETTATHTKATAAQLGGMVSSAAPCTFTDCVSRGTITVASPAFSTTLSGFVANASGGVGHEYIFTECINETALTGAGLLGGFVAKTPQASANGKFIFTDCINRADISAVSTSTISSAPTAGIAAVWHPDSKFIRCGNEGTILSEKNVYTAGIAGNNNGTPNETNPVFFTECYNHGPILAYGNQGAGICGFVTGAVTLTDCYNTADIEGNQMVAGICSGFNGKEPKMIGCYNTGNITASQQRAAGLIAWGGPTGGLVESCWNSGDIASTSEEQSTKSTAANEIGGLAGANDATFRNCYNVGKVKGLSRVGGLVGNPTKSATAFYNCYNAGIIEAPADSCGSIIGISSVDNGSRWNESNIVENTYYLSDNKCDADSSFTAATAITRRQLAELDLGEAFTSPDNFTHPVLKIFVDNEIVLFHAAELILHPDDSVHVTQSFNVGGGDRVVWTSDCPVITFEGNCAIFTADYTGQVKVTATAGELSKEYILQVDALADVSEITTNPVVNIRYFSPAGIEIAKPTTDGSLYIRLVYYSDGTIRVDKIVSK